MQILFLFSQALYYYFCYCDLLLLLFFLLSSHLSIPLVQLLIHWSWHQCNLKLIFHRFVAIVSFWIFLVLPSSWSWIDSFFKSGEQLYLRSKWQDIYIFHYRIAYRPAFAHWISSLKLNNVYIFWQYYIFSFRTMLAFEYFGK